VRVNADVRVGRKGVRNLYWLVGGNPPRCLASGRAETKPVGGVVYHGFNRTNASMTVFESP